MADSYILMKKRARVDDDDEAESELKRVRVDSDNSVVDSTKRIEDDLLSVLDDVETVPTGLESVMKSFEEEILFPATNSGNSSTDLGFLLEASDDELGLPPSFSSGDETSPTVDLDGVVFGFEDDQIPNYDSLKFVDDSVESNNNKIENNNNNNNNKSDEVYNIGDSLFDYSDESFESGGFSDSSWRHEFLSALW